jgi:hypothetical protein
MAVAMWATAARRSAMRTGVHPDVRWLPVVGRGPQPVTKGPVTEAVGEPERSLR